MRSTVLYIKTMKNYLRYWQHCKMLPILVLTWNMKIWRPTQILNSICYEIWWFVRKLSLLGRWTLFYFLMPLFTKPFVSSSKFSDEKFFFFQFKHWLFLPGFGEFFELLMESLLVQSQMRTPEPDIWKRKLHYYEITNMTIKHSKKISKKPLKRTLD